MYRVSSARELLAQAYAANVVDRTQIAVCVGPLVPVCDPIGIENGPNGVLEDSHAICPKSVLFEKFPGKFLALRLVCLRAHRQVRFGSVG